MEWILTSGKQTRGIHWQDQFPPLSFLDHLEVQCLSKAFERRLKHRAYTPNEFGAHCESVVSAMTLNIWCFILPCLTSPVPHPHHPGLIPSKQSITTLIFALNSAFERP